jgi:hypothetical protein
MKQAWCLAASRRGDGQGSDRPLRQSMRIESSLRDSKDLRFGMGMGSVHVSTPERRDRLWLINALAVVLLTLLEAASEAVGYDRILKTNTSKRRAHSLFRQGRPDPNDARALVTAADAGVYPTARPAAAVLSNSGPRVVALCSYEGVLRGITELAKL